MSEEFKKIYLADEKPSELIGQKMAEYPMLFAKPAFFGARPSKDMHAEVRNGTATIADLGTGPLAITCDHVLKAYEESCKYHGDIVFQVGNLIIDPINSLIDRDKELDIATIRLTAEGVNTLAQGSEIGSCVFAPVKWPSSAVKEGEFVAFGGFPGYLRIISSYKDLSFGTWSCGAVKVASVNKNRIVLPLERTYWIKAFGSDDDIRMTAIGGLSGGPVFSDRGLYRELVGIISEYNENYDTVFVTRLDCVMADGTIVRQQ